MREEGRALRARLAEDNALRWASMNAFVHGGFHALSRSRDGFPPKLAIDVVKLSNGLLHLTGRMLAVLTGSVQVSARVDVAYRCWRQPESEPILRVVPK